MINERSTWPRQLQIQAVHVENSARARKIARWHAIGHYRKEM